MCGFLAPKPRPSWASSLGGRNLPFFYLQDLASTSSGPYLHFLQELCWLHNPPWLAGPATGPGAGMGDAAAGRGLGGDVRPPGVNWDCHQF